MTLIIDTSSKATDLPQVRKKITPADIVVLLYDMTRQESIKRISYWMKLIHTIKYIHVILIGNKVDLMNQKTDALTIEEIEN